MFGFAAFVVILVVGILTLVGGLQLISGRREDALAGADDGRMDRLETALSALESRLDELQDQQRFLERLLADRPAPKSLEPGDEGKAAPSSDDVGSILFDTDEGEGGGD